MKLVSIPFSFEYDDLKRRIKEKTGEDVSDEVLKFTQDGYDVESCNYDEMLPVVEKLLLEQIQLDMEEKAQTV